MGPGDGVHALVFPTGQAGIFDSQKKVKKKVVLKIKVWILAMTRDRDGVIKICNRRRPTMCQLKKEDFSQKKCS